MKPQYIVSIDKGAREKTYNNREKAEDIYFDYCETHPELDTALYEVKLVPQRTELLSNTIFKNDK